MIRDSLRSVPQGQVDVTAPISIDGLSFVARDDPAMPMYRILANLRQPVALRDLMIAPVRSGYVGDGHPQDPTLVPMAGAEAVPNVDVDEVYLPVTDGVARCQLYRPSAAPADQRLPVIVYYHGGGFTVGSSDDCDFLSRKLAFTNDAVVVSANYRMAPEFPFPTPFDDAYEVYSWVVDNAHEIDGDSAPVSRSPAIRRDRPSRRPSRCAPARAIEEGDRRRGVTAVSGPVAIDLALALALALA